MGCTMGHLPASERPRSCSLGTGPFVFSGVALAPFLLLRLFHVSSTAWEYGAPAPVVAAKIKSAPWGKSLRGGT